MFIIREAQLKNFHDELLKGLLRFLKSRGKIVYCKYDIRPTFASDRYVNFKVVSLDSKESQIYFRQNGMQFVIGDDRGNEVYYNYNFNSEELDLRNVSHFVKLFSSDIKRLFSL